jgi:hypothetical protein
MSENTLTSSAPSRLKTPVNSPPPRRRQLALAVILACQLMVILDATVVTIALPGIQHALGFSSAGLSWVMNIYSLTFGGLLLLGGRAGDIFGRRRLLAWGIALFTLASLAGAWPPTPPSCSSPASRRASGRPSRRPARSRSSSARSATRSSGRGRSGCSPRCPPAAPRSA